MWRCLLALSLTFIILQGSRRVRLKNQRPLAPGVISLLDPEEMPWSPLDFNRPVDLVDLRTAGQPLLDQIVSTGLQVIGTRHQWGDLIYRNIMENEDFVPYQKRILEGRRNAWMSNS